jgi:hypothetical protein
MASSNPSNQVGPIDPNTPMFQPGGYDAATGSLAYESAAIWWWDNGIWGAAGYAIPNDGGKPLSGNETVRRIVKFIGKEMFSLMHRPDVKFSRPFNSEWLWDLHKMLKLGIKRMNDHAIGWTDDRDGDADHATNTRQAFTIFPIPFFGERIRQADASAWAGQVLLLLSEIMQHSDNDYDDNITDALASRVQLALKRIQKDMGMKYLGYTREQVEAPDWEPKDDDFGPEKYKPDALFTSQELIEERMPDQWWPSTNDLTPIAGIASVVARVWAKPWPVAGTWGDGGAVEAAWPGGGVQSVNSAGAATLDTTIIPVPGSRPTD